MITQEYLKELLHYDPDTGVFTWKIRSARHFKFIGYCNRWNTRYAGKVAGGVHKEGRVYYRMIGIDNVKHRAHRLAWLYVHGVFPKLQIDHKDGNGLNNRIRNLRDVGVGENQKNKQISCNNTSGCMGVAFNKPSGKWHARIHTGSLVKHLGSFINIEDAITARKAAEIEYGYHVNHGRCSNHLV